VAWAQKRVERAPSARAVRCVCVVNAVRMQARGDVWFAGTERVRVCCLRGCASVCELEVAALLLMRRHNPTHA
jgi:hypothetical protein